MNRKFETKERIDKAISSKNMLKAVNELADFVRICNNVESKTAIRNNAEYLAGILKMRGVSVEIWDTPENRPFVYGELINPDANTTILIYSHYDGVPVEKENWLSDPYSPVFRTKRNGLWETLPWPESENQFRSDYRLFGRSVADSKNAIIAVLSAIDALHKTGQKPGVNIKFLFDGEEERESPSLPEILHTRRTKLIADALISASGELHQSGFPTITFGARGILVFSLELYSSIAELHSGHFGNFAPNAAIMLSHLISALVGESGEIKIPEFEKQVTPLSPQEIEAISKVPSVEKEVAHEFGFMPPDVENFSLQKQINRPTLNLRGLSAGHINQEARNTIPNVALAEFDVRLVSNLDPDKTFDQIRKYVSGLGYEMAEHKPALEDLRRKGPIICMKKLAGFPASKSDLSSTIGSRCIELVNMMTEDNNLVIEPTEAGSLALHIFNDLGMEVLTMPISNHDCNQHSNDENLVLDTFSRGIDQWIAVLVWN